VTVTTKWRSTASCRSPHRSRCISPGWTITRRDIVSTKHLGLDSKARDRFKDDPAYERTVDFCAGYDEVSFDPRYPNEPPSTFVPTVRKLLAKAWVPLQ
jgi:hypothetical protein